MDRLEELQGKYLRKSEKKTSKRTVRGLYYDCQ